MLLLLLSSLFVLSNGVPMALQEKHLAATTKMGHNVANRTRGFDAKTVINGLIHSHSGVVDAKSLITELVDADPAKVREVVALVEAMLNAAQADLDRLTGDVSIASDTYDAAVADYDAAVVSQLSGVAAREDARLEALRISEEAARVEAQVIADAQSAKDVARGAKEGAQANFDSEKARLDAEIASLQQVITILNGLIASGDVYSWLSCHQDDGNRDFDGGPHQYGYTIQTCYEACSTFTHFALQDGGWCCCANHAPAYPLAPDSDCGAPCAGETSTLPSNDQYCGAGWRNAVYIIN